MINDFFSMAYAELSTAKSQLVQCLDCPCCPSGLRVGSGEVDARGKVGGVADWTDSSCVHAIKWRGI